MRSEWWWWVFWRTITVVAPSLDSQCYYLLYSVVRSAPAILIIGFPVPSRLYELRVFFHIKSHCLHFFIVDKTDLR